MEDLQQKLHITRVTQVDDTFITQLNSLQDEGTVWDIDQGKKFLENNDNLLLVAYWEKEIAGFLTAYRLQRFDKKKAEVLLYEIGVNENFRRKGIGKELIHALKKWTKEVGSDEIWVPTNKSNIEAVALYRSAGGITESTDEQIYTIKI